MVYKNKFERFFSLRNVVVAFVVIYFAVFLFYPIFRAFAGSMHNWNPMIDTWKFVGWDNFKAVLGDKLFWTSMSNTMIFTIAATFFRLLIGLALAMALYSKMIKHKTFWQALFYLPTITPLVAISFVWIWLYDPQFGLVDKLTGLDINWLKDSKYALVGIILMTIWKDFGYATVIYLGGLMGLPEENIEAAEMDGASYWQRFVYIILPLLKPTTIFILITSLISYLQTYVQIMIMTQGGPGTSTYTISYLIYDKAFVQYNFGEASAMSIILFIIIAILTMIMFKVTGEAKDL